MSEFRLVSLDDVKRNLRYIGNANDAELQQKLDNASHQIMDYLEAEWCRARQYSGEATDTEVAAYNKAFGSWTNSSGAPLTDSNGDPLIVGYQTDSNGDPVLDSNGDRIGGHSVIPGSVREATLLMIGALDENREGQVDPITPAVKSLLVRYRPPTVL